MLRAPQIPSLEEGSIESSRQIWAATGRPVREDAGRHEVGIVVL